MGRAWEGVLATHRPGSRLCAQGSAAEHVLVLEEGVVLLRRVAVSGDEIILGLRSATCLIGAAAVILGMPYPWEVIATSTCRVRRILAVRFTEWMRSDPSASWDVLELQSIEILEQISHVAGLAGFPARHRLEQFLWQLTGGAPQTRNCNVRLPVKHAELARLLAITPQYLSGLLGRLHRDGVLVRRGRNLILTDRERLSHTDTAGIYVSRAAARPTDERPSARRGADNGRRRGPIAAPRQGLNARPVR